MRNFRRFISGTTLGIFLGFSVLGGCHKAMTLEYVVPDGYIGIIKLRANVTNGVDLNPEGKVLVLVFPPSGILDINGPLPTFDWHTPVAKYANGTQIPIADANNNVPNDSVALRGLGVKSTNSESWYLVGKADEMQEAMKQFYGFDVPKK